MPQANFFRKRSEKKGDKSNAVTKMKFESYFNGITLNLYLKVVFYRSFKTRKTHLHYGVERKVQKFSQLKN